MTWCNAERDETQFTVIRTLMLQASAHGDWLTLTEIAEHTEFGEASISAQLRHMRKPQFGFYQVDKRRRQARREEPWRAVLPSGVAREVSPWEYFVQASRTTSVPASFEAGDAVCSSFASSAISEFVDSGSRSVDEERAHETPQSVPRSVVAEAAPPATPAECGAMGNEPLASASSMSAPFVCALLAPEKCASAIAARQKLSTVAGVDSGAPEASTVEVCDRQTS